MFSFALVSSGFGIRHSLPSQGSFGPRQAGLCDFQKEGMSSSWSDVMKEMNVRPLVLLLRSRLVFGYMFAAPFTRPPSVCCICGLRVLGMASGVEGWRVRTGK